LKQKYDEPLSNFAFNFNLRRYSKAAAAKRDKAACVGCGVDDDHGRAVQVGPIKPKSKSPGTKRLKLKYHKLLSSFAFKFNLRRYTTGCCATGATRCSTRTARLSRPCLR